VLFDLRPGVSELDELQSADPRRIGPYLLEGRLGSGGMGRVYLGRSPGGRHVAIKVIRADLAENPDFRARFAREASAARKVSGIFTAPVVDADLDGPVPWLATSYMAGPSLADAVAERGPMPSALATLGSYLAQSAAARPTVQNAIDADNDDHAWMADLASSGSACGSNPNQDSNYVAGGNASAVATTSTDAFLAIWNPMAPRYGQQTYSVTGL